MLPYPISICGLDELAAFAGRGVSHVASILDPGTPEPEAFAAFPAHERITFRFDDVIEARDGFRCPNRHDIAEILAFGADLRHRRVNRLVIHCHAGVSRSPAAAAILMAQATPGREADVFARLDQVRRRNWPNSLMIELADRLLGRSGALARALRAHHARVAERDPDLAELIRRHGRAHELPYGW